MENNVLQVGKTTYAHYMIAYHLVWIPKYRRKILAGEVQAETKRLMTECCERHGRTLLAMETDVDHIHVFVSAPPRFSPANLANLLKGVLVSLLTREVPASEETVWKGAFMGAIVLCWDSRSRLSRNDQTLH